MKVSVDISSEYIEPYAVIYTDKVTDSIQRTIDMIGTNNSPVIAQQNNGDMVILQPHDIDKVTDEIQHMIDLLGSGASPITALKNEEDLVVLSPDEIYMVRVENGETVIYTDKKMYRSRKRLYEINQQH